jgi:sugar diacid utilization regulator
MGTMLVASATSDLARAFDSQAAACVARALDLLSTAAQELGIEAASQADVLPRVETPAAALLGLVRGAPQGRTDLIGPVRDGRLVVIAGAGDVLSRLRSLSVAPKRSVGAIRDGEWLLFLPGLPKSSGKDVSLRGASRLLETLERCGRLTWTAGVSAPLRAAEELPAAYRDATDAAALAVQEDSRAVFVEAAWARLAVARVRSVSPSVLPARSPLDLLVAYDRKHGCELLSSLSAWLSANADTAAAARVLGVHVNTLRYRVRRAAEVAGLDLDDADQRLVLQLLRRQA